MTGGKSVGNDCEPFAYHGYNGIERETIDAIKKWIKQGEGKRLTTESPLSGDKSKERSTSLNNHCLELATMFIPHYRHR
jgi:hypothetical protein